MGRLKVYPELQDYGQRLAIYLHEQIGEDRVAVGTSVSFEERKAGLSSEPAFHISREAGQELFEQLWALGFRSAHDHGNPAALDKARQEHIGDLRKAAKLA